MKEVEENQRENEPLRFLYKIEKTRRIMLI